MPEPVDPRRGGRPEGLPGAADPASASATAAAQGPGRTGPDPAASAPSLSPAASPFGTWPQQGRDLALFPLRAVVLPEQPVALQVFEARYLDLMGQALRSARPFAFVPLLSGAEAGESWSAEVIGPVGVLARVVEVEAPGPGLLRVQALAGPRVALQQPRAAAQNLWQAESASALPDLPAFDPPPAEQAALSAGLRRALPALAHAGMRPDGAEAWRLDDPRWLLWTMAALVPVPSAQRRDWLQADDGLALWRAVWAALLASPLAAAFTQVRDALH